MNVLRKHWYDIGGFLAIPVLAFAYWGNNLASYDILLWLSLVSLFFHQMEEYRVVGTFPGMVNRVMYDSDMPDRYPLNTNSSLIVNVFFGWSAYFLAAMAGEKAVWLGMATILVSLGNIVAHTTVFNIKGKTLYNAGLATSWLFFAPCVYFFFKTIHRDNLVTMTDYLIGVPLGIAFNVVGIMKIIDWLADRKTTYIFEQRNLLPADRNSKSS